VDVFDSPDPAGTILFSARVDEILALLRDKKVAGWLHVLHVSSGRAGWVPNDKVSVVRTRHPQAAPSFAQEYVGDDRAPEIIIHNKTEYELTVSLRSGNYSIKAYQDKNISPEPGISDFQAYVTAPHVIPLSGKKEFQQGYKYNWTFWVATGSTRTIPPN
jgi:hypothetical protein